MEPMAGWRLGWGELTQSCIELGNTAVIPEDTTALPNMSRLISCSICLEFGGVGLAMVTGYIMSCLMWEMGPGPGVTPPPMLSRRLE